MPDQIREKIGAWYRGMAFLYNSKAFGSVDNDEALIETLTCAILQYQCRFLIIDNGRVLKELSKEELDNECSRATVLHVSDVKGTAVLLEQNYGIRNFKVIDNTEIRVYDEHLERARINRSLVQNNIDVSAIYETGITLEEYFKKVIEEEGR